MTPAYNQKTTHPDLEAALKGKLPEYLIPKAVAFCYELLEHEQLEHMRRASRERTIPRQDLVAKAYSIAKRYANKTLDPTKERGDERRCGGLLILLGDWYEPGMSDAYLSPEGKLPPQIEGGQEKYLSHPPFDTGISLADENRQGLDDLLDQYLKNPHSNRNDLAIFVNNADGEIKSTHAYVEGVRGTELPEDPRGFSGGARFRAAQYFSYHNPDAVAVMVSAGEGAVYVIQHGRVKQAYDADCTRDVVFEEISSYDA